MLVKKVPEIVLCWVRDIGRRLIFGLMISDAFTVLVHVVEIDDQSERAPDELLRRDEGVVESSFLLRLDLQMVFNWS